MTPAEIQQTLQAGMDALKRGQKRPARELLIRVIEADERNETAWLWLSAAVESLDDQITALENVLDINPQNKAAQKGLEQLRAKREAERPPAPPPVIEAPIAEEPAVEEPVVIEEDPLGQGGGPDAELNISEKVSAFGVYTPAVSEGWQETRDALEPEEATESHDWQERVTPTPAFIQSDYSPEDNLRMEMGIEDGSLASTPAFVSPVVDDISQYANSSPLEYESNLDDPSQCIYCGAIIAPELFTCTDCGRNLAVRSGKDKMSSTLRTTIVVGCVSIAVAAVSALYIVVASSTGTGEVVRYIFEGLGLEWLFGDYLAWTQPLTNIVMGVQIALPILMAFAILALAYQVTFVYYVSVGLWGLNVLWSVTRWTFGYGGLGLMIGDIVASVFTLFFIFAAQPDFQVNLVRLRCAVDPRMKGGEPLHNLGLIYRKEGKWALAVTHWRAAIAAMPNKPEFYKDLAIGYAEIGYYKRALNTLDEFARQSPEDKDIGTMRTLIDEKRAADPKPKG
jgi:tetratricopeptide (TPR) repeat protein